MNLFNQNIHNFELMGIELNPYKHFLNQHRDYFHLILYFFLHELDKAKAH